MRKGYIFALVSVLICSAAGVAMAVRPSGPGQSTAANSLSVAVASDQRVSVKDAPPTLAVAITPSDDAGVAAFAACTHSIYVGIQDAGTLQAIPSGSDAGVQFSGLSAGSVIPGSFNRIQATNTTAGGIVCRGY